MQGALHAPPAAAGGSGTRCRNAAGGRGGGRASALVVHAQQQRFDSGRRESGLILGPGSGIGRNNNNGNQQGGQQQRLIFPGQTGGGMKPGTGGGGSGKIVFPNKQSVLDLPDDTELGLVSDLGKGAAVNGPPTVNKFRPPAGFMNEQLPEDDTANLDPQQMLNRLRARAGRWHELAKLIPSLNSKGYDSTLIDELAGVTPVQQNEYVVSATVYESLREEGMPQHLMEYFDSGGEELLYPLRFLEKERRLAAAEYIIEQELDPTMCDVLARAMKEFERRPLERYGFTESPADCLAFKYLRDAIECRWPEEVEQKLQQALKVAETQGARNRVMSMLQEDPDAGIVSPTLIILRLSPDELGVRPVVVLGDLGAVDGATAAVAPRTSQSGAFGMFSLDQNAGEWRWVALPQWRALSMARHPVALIIKDCAAVSSIVMGSMAKTDDDRRRLQGSGMLVADKDPASFSQIDPDAWYLAAPEGSRSTLQVVDGRRAAGLHERGQVVAVVMFLARPPVKEAVNKGAELLQL